MGRGAFRFILVDAGDAQAPDAAPGHAEHPQVEPANGDFVADAGQAAELVDEEAPYNYRMVIGNDYNPCRPAFEAPQAAP